MKLKDFFRVSLLSLVLSAPGCCNYAARFAAETQQITEYSRGINLSEKEKELVKKSFLMAEKRYGAVLNPLEVIVLEAEGKDKNLGGEAYYRLCQHRFKQQYGKELFALLKGRNTAVIRDFSFYEQHNSFRTWSSIYMPNPSAEQLYTRAVLHELGHIVYHNLPKETAEIIAKLLFEIDVKGEVADKGNEKSHPAHPAFHTFFYAGFKEALESDRQDLTKDLIYKNADETFADIFAFRAMGLLDNVPDQLLQQKIRLVEEILRIINKTSK